MTRLDVVARIGGRVDAIGGTWMGKPVMDVGAALGFEGYPWPFYMVGRGGVLGDVDPSVVAEAMVFPSPALVRSAWVAGRDKLTVEDGVAKFIDCAYRWAPDALGGAPGLERADTLLGQLVAGVEVDDAPLARGWRDVPAPDGLPERVAWAINVLREHRGGVHATCVVAAGLSPVDAVMATEGEVMAKMYSWDPPYPDPEEAKVRKAPVERATNERVAAQYAFVGDAALSELADLLEQITPRP